ncbi:hypothetical protein [Wenjunlia tyrosinilytica]|uniref:Uncharacterized protein n=1 Tax=Wenjunlia tyrosinilytica TaxID=1544741 RepID=A0A917ZVM5_9ACTN|nr:hypothetical protein [Wenjunlia tyrosinilytica]GGO94351.1 hypothetical protein GCM10012280_48970 [Wenjunlia tyrosinilytica]
MQDNDGPSPTSDRLTQERLELARELARELAEAELASSVSPPGNAQLEILLTKLAERFRLLWDHVTGGSQSMPTGADASFADGPETDAPGPGQDAPGWGAPAPTPPTAAEPWQPSVSQTSARARLEEKIDQLPPAARMAFEDEILHLVRTNAELTAAVDRFPERVPTVAKYARNAHLRESLREAPPPAESPRQARVSVSDDVTRPTTAGAATSADWSWQQFEEAVAQLPARSQALSSGSTGINDRASGTAEGAASERHAESGTSSPTPGQSGSVSPRSLQAADPDLSTVESKDRTQPPSPTIPLAPRVIGELGHEVLQAQVARSKPTTSGTGHVSSPSLPPGRASGRLSTGSQQPRTL